MTYTALSTHPTLQGKSRELRLLFAETANTALSKGRTQDEAIFQGLAVVKQKERRKVKKYVKPSVPLHLKAILDVRSASNLLQEAHQTLEIEKAAEVLTNRQKDVVGASFTDDGRLVLKFKDGTELKTNPAPIMAVEHSVIVVGDGNGTTVSGDENIDGGSATSVFQIEEVIDGGSSSG